MTTIFEASRRGDVEAVRSFLDAGVDLEAKDSYGFTALHCAATACNKADASAGLQVIEALLAAGASPNAMSTDGRSVLFRMAESSWTLRPVQVLVESGANPNVTDSHGNHIVVNALSPDVKQYLSGLTGHPIPPPPLEVKERRLGFLEWRRVKARLDSVFEELNRSGLVALQDAGYTQDDGFSDCSELFHERGGVRAGLTGICFYTRQDLVRAKRTGTLSLAFWGAPEGAPESTVRVGQKVVTLLDSHGFTVEWAGTSSERPSVYLHG